MSFARLAAEQAQNGSSRTSLPKRSTPRLGDYFLSVSVCRCQADSTAVAPTTEGLLPPRPELHGGELRGGTVLLVLRDPRQSPD